VARGDRGLLPRRRLAYRSDSSNRETRRGLIRDEILPLLRRLHPGAERNLLRLADAAPVELDDLLAATAGSRRVDLGGGLTAVREYDRVWLEQTPLALEGRVRWGEWTIESELAGLKVRSWRPGDRLAGRRKKVQDVFVDAKIPRSEREAWPLVVKGRDVVAVPGLVEAPGSRRSDDEHAARRAIGEILIDEETLAARVAELGAEVSADYEGRDLLLIGVLKGAVFFMADLMRHLTVHVRGRLHGDLELRRCHRLPRDRPHPQGPRHQHRRPRRARRRGHHRLRPDPLVPDAQPGVARAGQPRGLRPPDQAVAARDRRPVRYVGFEIPNKFVVGYGSTSPSGTGTCPTSAYWTSTCCRQRSS
jgi:tRNA(Ile)-lysidine synthetase-like protein